jgi:hypothetical protein
MKIIAAVIFGMLFSSFISFAQEANVQPVATGAVAATGDTSTTAPVKLTELNPAPTPHTTESQHRFFDSRNAFAASALAVGLAGDSWSTQRALAYPGTREANPLARPFVASSTGAAVYSGSSLGLLLGGMYLAHKTNHHKLERVVPWVLAGWETFLTGWNLHQISRVH